MTAPRPLLAFALLLAISALPVYGQGIRFGGHAVGSIGDDIRTPSGGVGGHGSLAIGRYLALELQGAYFTDSLPYDNGVLDVVSCALTVSCKAPLGETLHVYAGGGIGYDFLNADANLAEIVAFGNGRSVEEHAAMFGMTERDFVIWADALGARSDMTLKNRLTGVACAGIAWRLEADMEVFVDYRHTFGEIEGDLWVEYQDVRQGIEFEMDYSYGLVRLGMNFIL